MKLVRPLARRSSWQLQSCEMFPFQNGLKQTRIPTSLLCNLLQYMSQKSRRQTGGTASERTSLTSRNLASYIQGGRRITLQMPHFIFIQQISVLNILNMLYNLIFFSSKCRLFHNATLFGFCITHILNTGCAKI